MRVKCLVTSRDVVGAGTSLALWLCGLLSASVGCAGAQNKLPLRQETSGKEHCKEVTWTSSMLILPNSVTAAMRWSGPTAHILQEPVPLSHWFEVTMDKWQNYLIPTVQWTCQHFLWPTFPTRLLQGLNKVYSGDSRMRAWQLCLCLLTKPWRDAVLLQADTFQPEVPLLEECKMFWKVWQWWASSKLFFSIKAKDNQWVSPIEQKMLVSRAALGGRTVGLVCKGRASPAVLRCNDPASSRWQSNSKSKENIRTVSVHLSSEGTWRCCINCKAFKGLESHMDGRGSGEVQVHRARGSRGSQSGRDRMKARGRRKGLWPQSGPHPQVTTYFIRFQMQRDWL